MRFSSPVTLANLLAYGIKDDNRLENLELLGCNGKHNTMLNRKICQLEKEIAHLKKENAILIARYGSE